MFSSTSILTALLLSIAYQSVIAQNTTASGTTATSPPSITSLAAGLSTSCQTSAGSLLTSDFGSCANIVGLASIIGATGSIVPPLNTWITSICAADPCSNSTLASAQKTITSGCSDDTEKGSPLASGLSSIVGNYAAFRNLLCAQYVSNSTFCVPSLLENVQTAAGQNLSLAAITTLMTTGFQTSAFSKVTPSAYCNDCGHALVTLSAPLAAAANASMASSMSSGKTMNMSTNASASNGVCGASFNDGKLPSSVKIGAKGTSAAASNAQNNAGVRDHVSVASVLFVALVSSLAVLAC